MNCSSKYKVDKVIVLLVFLMALIGLVSIGSAMKILGPSVGNLLEKQIIWYIIGIVTIFIVLYFGNDFIYKNIFILYIIGIASLGSLLLFASPINNAKSWFSVPGIGSIQPSEFMKIILILTNAVMIKSFNDNYPNPTVKDEFLFLIKIGVVVLIPSLLTFLQPDTGVVLIYLLITIVMLFISGIRYRWFMILFGVLGLTIGVILVLYLTNTDLFVKIFGTDFFLRVDRLLDWSNKDGYQLSNGIAAIGSGGLTGWGLNKTPIYFPEAQTDFIFAVYASNFGFLGSILLIGIITLFDIKLIKLAIKTKRDLNKYVLAGIIGMLIYQQLQNIGMTFGLMPITGITLPYISYGGSSLLSYMIMTGIVFGISNEYIRYTNK